MKLSIISPRQRFSMISFFLAFVTMLIGYGGSYAQTIGPNYADNGANVNASGGNRDWTNPGNTVSLNTSYATSTLNASPAGQMVSKYLQTTGYGFSIPNDATILGIRVFVTRKASLASQIKDENIQLLKAGVIQTENKANSAFWSTTDETVSYGDVDDSWGTWTPAQINAANFGVSLRAKNEVATAVTASVDAITVEVTVSNRRVPLCQDRHLERP
jgi:large repetitive protein